MALFEDLFNVVKDVTQVVITPVEVVASLASDVTKPVVETVKALADDIKSITK